MSDGNATILRFLIEFRRRLVYSLLALALVFLILFSFANKLYTWLALPLLHYLPKGQGLIATNVIAPFMVPFEFTCIVAVFITVPVFLYHLWAFVAPALYKHEKKLIWPLMLVSMLLFYTGVAFAYWVIFPVIFKFLTSSAPQGVLISPDITLYLDFTLKLFFIFGVVFEVPVATVLLIWTGVTTRDKLIKYRPYIIVSAFIAGMLFAPPDVLSQTLLAIPLWFLYEVGLLFAKFFPKK